MDQWNRGILQKDILATIFRVVVGFGIGAALARASWARSRASRADPTRPSSRRSRRVRSIPTLAWAPLLLLWLGIDETPKVTLVAIGAFFPVYVNLVAGIRGVDRKLVEVARIYDLHATGRSRGGSILPASLPSLFTGLRLGFSQAWLFVVVAEIFGATRGLGFRLTDSQQLHAGRPDAGRDARPRDPGQGHRHDPGGDRAPGARAGATRSQEGGL